MSHVKIEKDKKGPCYIISHERSGITECLFMTINELKDLKRHLAKVVR